MILTTHPAPGAEPAPPPRKGAKSKDEKLRIAERRRERKAEARPERERKAEETVQGLLFARDRIPPGAEFDEWRKEINRLIHRIRKSGKRTPDRDLDAVTAAMRKPLVQTVGDIALEAGLPDREVQKILDGMVSIGTATRRPKKAPSISRGAPAWLYFLTGAKPRTDMVLP